jgi:phosphoenolpyruvate synthase/pyruvate phosphate dikinase
MSDIGIQSFGLGDPVVHTSNEYLGGKGAGLVWMDQQGVSVPPGFVLPTTLWAEYKLKPKTTLKMIECAIEPFMEKLKAHFGYMPLLSVRSGARVSCPGMMDTILNVGLDSTNEALWTQKLGEVCYTDSLHRLVVMYGSVVKGMDRKELESVDLNKALSMYQRAQGEPFPMAKAQVINAVEAVLKSWDNERAVFYRKMNNIPAEWGTACVVQSMVFGNLNDNSGTGVLFTRDPDTGDGKILGEFLVNAQGEDVVAGIKTPMKLEEMSNWNGSIYGELSDTVLKLEAAKGDVQDVEFTIQDGKLYILQTRNAKRSARAALKIALDMVDEGMITAKQAAQRVKARDLDLAQSPVVDPSFKEAPAYTGIPACSGVVRGSVVLSAAEAIKMKALGKPVILVTEETTPDDIEGMNAAVGVLTMTGGATSHAAVVARGMNKTCIVGLGTQHHDDFKEGMLISLDGATGRVWLGEVPVVQCDMSMIDRFKSLVLEALGAHQVVFSATGTKAKALWFVAAERVLTPAALVDDLIKACSKAETVYLDFSSKSSHVQSFLRQIGADDEDLKELRDTLSLMAGKLPNLTLVGLEAQGFKSIKAVTSLEDLILAEGEMVGSLEPSPAVNKVMTWKQKEGVGLISLGTVTPGKSFVSFEQALQLIAQ